MLPLLLALQAAGPDPGPVYNGLAKHLDVRIPRVETTVEVDGVLDEPVWREAAVLTGFSQYRPVDGRPAEDSTEVLVWYAPDAIYFGIRAFEPHGHVVRATLADRDNIDTDDRVEILLDTYLDHRRAMLFAVNPLGVQEDGVWTDGVGAGAAGGPSAGGRFDATIDLNPDYVYESRGHVTDWGYEVEVRIPFKSLRYQSADPQDWGLQIVRVTQHSGYEATWTPAVRANASFLIQSGRLVGLTGLRRGVVLDVTPEFTTKVDGAPTGTGYDYRGTPEVAGNLRWGVTQNLGVTATAHPDFSQVEADIGQVTLNERFALFYPEKRPFFLEGLEQFDTPNQLIYTRRIVQPVVGAKLAGKAGGTGIAYLGAVDNTSQSATGANPVYNLLRLRRDLGPSSTVGLVYTDRTDGGTYNRVLGFDARVVWRKIWFSQVQIAGAWTRDSAGGRAGKLWTVTFGDRTGRAYGNHYELLGIERTFQDTSGFVNRTDFVVGRTYNRFSWYGRPGALVEQFTAILAVAPIWRYRDLGRLRRTIEDTLQTFWIATLRGGWQAQITLSADHFGFDAAQYGGYRVGAPGGPAFIVPHDLYHLPGTAFIVNTPNRAVSGSLVLGYGAVAIFDEAAEGRQVALTAIAALRPTPSLRLEGRWVHQRITRARDGSRFSTANIPRLKLEYQLSRAIFVRYVGQYFAQDQVALVDPRSGQLLFVGGSPASAVVTNAFRNDLLFSYKPTPGTVLFVGYGSSLTEPDAFRFRNLSRASDGFYLKVSYLFRM
ncbi:MAG TPA: DUF5916 domain-containing protein [Gemmatimonadales bacterium]|nr:DUF5916 domain-containing protein [Gemmatimonadales bacterium]